MAVISSVDAVLGIIAYKVKVYNDVLRDPVAKTILSHSPPQPRKQYLSRSLDIAESKMAAAAAAAGKERDALTAQQEQERKQRLANEEAAKLAIKAVKFEKASPAEAFEFVSSPVASEPAVAPASQLANLIRSMPTPTVAKETNVTRTERVKVKVFVPEGPPLVVDVPKVATVGEVIWSAIQLYDEEKRQPPLVKLTLAYQLKMAEEDGTSEEILLKCVDPTFFLSSHAL